MAFYDVFLLAVALAMDCFAVSIVSGVVVRKFVAGVTLRMAVLFGLFQALMPFVGWLGTNHFSEYLESVDHWIAFGLLAFLGVKMIKDSFSGEECGHIDPQGLKSQTLFAVATSIDALAVGISFACLGYRSADELVVPLAVIGTVSFVMSLIRYSLGVRFGAPLARRCRPALLGGVILLAIGVKILVGHLCG